MRHLIRGRVGPHCGHAQAKGQFMMLNVRLGLQ